MKQIRWRVILMIAWLTLLFNIERIDTDRQSLLNLASFVYVLAAAIAGFFLVVPLGRRQMYLAVGGVLIGYLALKIVQPAPMFHGVYKYMTITEAIALVITAYLTWQVSLVLQDFDQAVEAISLPTEGPRILPYPRLLEQLQAGLRHARRHQHPISVAMIELDPATFAAALHQAVREAQAAMIERYVQARFGVFMTRHIRETDLIAQSADAGRFVVVAPETPARQTAEMLARLSQQVEQQMGIAFRFSIADFPLAALTSEELLRRVTEDLRDRPANVAYPDGEPLGQPSADNGDDRRATMPNMLRDTPLEECK